MAGSLIIPTGYLSLEPPKMAVHKSLQRGDLKPPCPCHSYHLLNVPRHRMALHWESRQGDKVLLCVLACGPPGSSTKPNV